MGSPGFGHRFWGEELVLWVQMSMFLFIVSHPQVLPLLDRSRGVCVGGPQARKEGRKGVKEEAAATERVLKAGAISLSSCLGRQQVC